uniref:RNA polymerase II assembly factor Rtp1 C-terminal domain-containing protein n=1 Tax=Parascaris univalens TaxID=6257 RepID=A0A915CFL3_PARUN
MKLCASLCRPPSLSFRKRRNDVISLHISNLLMFVDARPSGTTSTVALRAPSY